MQDILLHDKKIDYYRPKRSFGQRNIFTGVCDSVHGGGGVPPNFRGGVSTGIRSTFGRYTSYWNAFLLLIDTATNASGGVAVCVVKQSFKSYLEAQINSVGKK